MAILDRQFRLPDGRRLGYNEYGPPGGKPLFYFHGSPSARVEFTLFSSEGLLTTLNVRLIAADRPGLGLSDFQPDRRLLDWPDNVLALAGHLGIERFSVLAYSLGGPYGLVCAYAIPERLHRVGILSGAAQFHVPVQMAKVNPGTQRYLNLPRERPWAARSFLWMMRLMARFYPRLMVANAASLLPEPDREIFSDPEFQQGFIRMLHEGLRQGTAGAFHESLLAITDWGFQLQDIQTPILLWHGALDRNIPAEMAQYTAGTLPASELKLYPTEGHLSLFKKHARELITSLMS